MQAARPRPRPRPIVLPEEVPGQVTKAEVIRHQARAAARWRVALALFKLGDQLSEGAPINDWREYRRAGGLVGYAYRQRRSHGHSLSQGDALHSRSSRQKGALPDRTVCCLALRQDRGRGRQYRRDH